MQIVVYFKCNTLTPAVLDSKDIVTTCVIIRVMYYVTRTMILTFPKTYNSLPTDVQAEAIPLILGGGDVLMVNLSEFKMLVYCFKNAVCYVVCMQTAQ